MEERPPTGNPAPYAALSRYVATPHFRAMNLVTSEDEAAAVRVAGAACVTCGTPLRGAYCHACGEKADLGESPRLGAFLRESLEGAFDLDSRFWRSFHTLVHEPGLLTAEYIRGRRVPYIAPLKVFLLANVLFFAALEIAGGFSTFTTLLQYHRTQPLYGSIAAGLVAEHGVWGTASAMLYERRFDAATPRYANTMIILIVPIVALMLKALMPRRPYLHHLAFALHFMAYVLLVLTVLPFVVTGVIVMFPAVERVIDRGEGPISLLLLAVFGIYAARACHRAYGGARLTAYARAAGLVLALLPIIIIYRMILFFAVYYTL